MCAVKRHNILVCSEIFLVKQKAHTQGHRIEAKIGKNLVTFMYHKSLILANQLK